MQWRHTMADVSGIDTAAAGSSSTTTRFAATDTEEDEDNDENGINNNNNNNNNDSDPLSSGGGGDPLMDLLDGPGGGDESGAIKPWLGAIRAPKNPPPISSQAPAVHLDLQWVHGYTSASAGAGENKYYI